MFKLNESTIRNIDEMLIESETWNSTEWHLKSIQSEHCISYIAWNSTHEEAILIDPKEEDLDAYRLVIKESGISNYLWLAVVDTHTHADHFSIASQMAQELHAPLLMHGKSPSQRVDLRVMKDTILPSKAKAVQFFLTPGHTHDSISVMWGPFLFGGDTLIFGDVGRDDLPTGSPEDHFSSVQRLKNMLPAETILLGGHDHRPARCSSLGHQISINPSFTQSREDYVKEALVFDAPAPKLLKKSLFLNFK